MLDHSCLSYFGMIRRNGVATNTLVICPAKVKEKADKITIESLRTDVVEGQNAIENLNKKLVEISLQVNEKEESLSKLREEHQAG